MGREFIELFDRWADHYDGTVAGQDEEYRDVFEGYEDILEAVASRVSGTVLEFGVGTGNLTERLLLRCAKVYGVEPSEGMREQAAKRQLAAEIMDGDFLAFPPIGGPIDAIVSTYAFHHLSDEEKGQAIAGFGRLLGPGGRVVFADTAFENIEARMRTEEAAEKAGHVHLLNDLRTEYYPTLSVLETLFRRHGFTVSFSRLNRFVWLMDASKIAEAL